MPRAPVLIAALTSLVLTGPGLAQDGGLGPGLAGSYLAARAAVFDGNHRAAALYYERALAADPSNTFLIGNAIFANAALGQWRQAYSIATELPADAPGQELANIVIMVEGLRQGDLVGARAAIEARQGAGPFIDDLALGWIYLGEGDMRRAAETFEAVAQDPGLSDIGYAHLALARAAVGDFEGADAILSGDAFGRLSMTERLVEARAKIMVQLDRRQDAIDLLAFYTDAVPDPGLLAVYDELRTQTDVPPYDFITTPQQGLAEVFFNVARALGADGGSTTLPLLYTRAAHVIDPDHHAAVMYAGQILADDEQFELAAEAFNSIPEASEQYIEGQLAAAESLFEGVDEELALAALDALATNRPDLATVHAAHGDLLRRTEDCLGAIDAYTRAIDLLAADDNQNWFLFYTRAICYEQTDNWPPAEADFRQALELNPDQPNVLNYLGYSLVEQRRNLDEALNMIERAVEARPDSGYIVDSLGWVLYRLGRFEEAVEPMERAVALEPNDPVINDHLGDVYWMVGRYREAEFQWHRALSFEPEEVDAERIRQKLETGLYDVLEVEGGVGETQ